jgi:sugar phosphate isomerase/epimerase
MYTRLYSSTVKILTLVYLTLATASNVFAQPTIGLELYSLRNQFPKDIPGTLEKVKQMGFKEVELAGTYGMSNTEFKKMLDGKNLKVVSVSTEFDQLANNPMAAVEYAKAFGAKYVVCFWIPHTNNEFTIDDTKKAISVFNAAGKVLHENGLSLCYHPHGYEFRPYEQETLFDYLVKNLNPKWANFEMDVFWIKHPGQEPVSLLKKYPKRFLLMHLKDRRPGTPGNQNGQTDVESNVVLGRGDVGIAAVVRQAKKSGVKHFFIEDESSRSEEQIPKSLQFLRSIR